VRIVENWEAPRGEGSTRTIHVYSNAPLVALDLNGAAVGNPQPGGRFSNGMPTFKPTYADGTLTAKAMAADGTTVLGTHSISSWSQPSAINLTMDVPSLSTGTGTAVYVDGMDVALLRATIVDVNGKAVLDATTNVTFTIKSGPGFVAGVGNGDPSSREPSQVH
jgi:beta-galactosidase